MFFYLSNAITKNKTIRLYSDTMDDEKILQKFHYERNHSKNTIKNYSLSVKQYVEYSGKTLTDLLTTAQHEERERIPWIDRSLKDELLGFRAYLYEKYNGRTAAEYYMNIQAILRHNFVEIHYLPPISKKQVKKSKPVTFKDLPTRSLLQTITNLTNPIMTAINHHMVSTAMSKVDCLNLRVSDYFESFVDYDIKWTGDIYEDLKIIQDLNKEKTIVSTYYHSRQKTGIQFYTFAHPESVESTTEYLLTRRNLTKDSKLFKINGQWLSTKFQRINDDLNLGKVGKYNRYTTKMLRRYHATTLKKVLDIDKVDFLQGRQTLSSTQQAYYFENYDDLKQEFIEKMNVLYIHYENKVVSVESPEFLELKHENNTLKTEIKNHEKKILDIVQDELKKYGLNL